MLTNNSAYDRVKRILDAQNIRYFADDPRLILTGRYIDDLNHPKRPTRFELTFQDEYLINVTSWDLRVKPSDFAQKAMNVALLNNMLKCGNFLIDIIRGEILYKNVMSFTALEHCCEDELVRFVSLPTTMFFEYENRLNK